LPLPLPVADSVNPAEVVVRPSDDINLVPDLTRSAGLVPRTNVEPAVTGRNDSVNVFHFRSTSAEASFAGERVPRSREVTHKALASIELQEALAHIEQRVDYNVRHVAIQQLQFDIPGEISSRAVGDLEVVLLAGSNDATGPSAAQSEEFSREFPLRLLPQPEEPQGTTADGVRKFQAALPQPMLGQFSVILRYDVARSVAPPSEDAWQIPLPQPLDGQMISQRTLCRPARRLSVSLDPTTDPSTWQQISSEVGPNPISTLEFVAAGPQTYLPMIVRSANANLPSETFVDRQWLQTWISNEQRQDRAAFRFRTSGAQVAVELAPQTPDALEVLIDGEPARVLSREPGRITVAVPQSRQPAASTDAAPVGEMLSHTLELRSRSPISIGVLTRHALTPHQMIGSTTLAEIYWQVVLPGDTHLVQSPRQMVAASVWQWLGSFWGRSPARPQEELESWAGASSQAAPSDDQNEYLFTGIAPVSTMQFITSPRWLIVLAASSCALGAALALIYVPAIRARWVLVPVACLLAGLALSFPIQSLLLAQASALGLVMAMVATIIARLAARPTPWPLVVPPSGTHREVAPPVESIVVPPVAAAASTAPTISLRMPESE
jgi:hypothetical protein